MHYLICLLIFLIGCQTPSGSEVKVYKYGDELELRLGEVGIIDGVDETIEFVDVLEDSRCPLNVECIWAGNGKVQIRFSSKEIQLNTFLEPQKITISEVRIELISLTPYPEYPGEIDKDDYKIRLLITRE